MLDLLSKKYGALKIYAKYNKDGKYDEEINDEIISLYTSILGYYSAKMDFTLSDDYTEKLQDKIMLESYDKKLLKKTLLDGYIDYFINPNSKSKKSEFYSTIRFLKITKNKDEETLKELKQNYDDAYLATVLNIKNGNFTKKYRNKVYKIHQKSNKIVEKELK